MGNRSTAAAVHRGSGSVTVANAAADADRRNPRREVEPAMDVATASSEADVRGMTWSLAEQHRPRHTPAWRGRVRSRKRLPAESPGQALGSGPGNVLFTNAARPQDCGTGTICDRSCHRCHRFLVITVGGIYLRSLPGLEHRDALPARFPRAHFVNARLPEQERKERPCQRSPLDRTAMMSVRCHAAVVRTTRSSWPARSQLWEF